MSEEFTSHLINLVNEYVKSQVQSQTRVILQKISDKYEIKMNELIDIANGTSSTSSSKTSNSIVDVIMKVSEKETSARSTDKRTVVELKALCKDKGLPVSGTKAELIARLQRADTGEVTATAVVSSSTKTTKKPATPTSTLSPMIRKLQESRSVLSIRKNEFGHFMHTETKLVFDNDKSQIVIGTQADDGDIYELDEDDIEKCKQYGFKYQLPSNLDATDTQAVQIEELDSDDLEKKLIKQDESDDEVESVIEDDD